MSPVNVVWPRVSYPDLERAPEDGRRYELYDGEVFVVPAPLPLHQLVVDRFADALKAYRQEHGGLVFFSPLDIVFSEFDVAQPDVVFFERGRERLIDLRKPIRVSPDLAVEVLSPSTAATDRGKKMQLFARYGVREYWLVDPDARTLEVYWLAGDAYLLVQSASDSGAALSTILPGFSVSASALFDS